jgi:hypothetical protein
LTQVCPIQLRDPKGRAAIVGRLFNRSETGFYFESDRAYRPGTEVYIGMREADGAGADYRCVLGRVVWCRELGEDSNFFYGCGVRAIGDAEPPVSAPGREQRAHPRRTFNRTIHLSDADGPWKALAGDISGTGVFVKSGKQPRVGRTLTLGIPTSAGKTVVVRAKVMWANAGGFGLKFVREGGL